MESHVLELELEESTIEEDDVLDYFMEAQRMEEEDEIPLAIECYKEIIHVFGDYKKKPAKYIHINGYFESPPPLLVLSCALNSLGGIYMDQEQYEFAMESFYEATLCWNENYMALLNMANIEREHRSIEKAIGHYKHIIKLSEKQNAGGSNDMQEQTHDAWEATWIIGPHQKCVLSLLYVSFVSSPSWKIL